MDRATCARIADLHDTRLQRCYVKAKLASDPVHAATPALIAGTPLPLLDIGCGPGLLEHYLHAPGHWPPCIRLDHDARKIAAAQRAVHQAGSMPGWIPGGVRYYPTANEVRKPLENAGLDVHIESLHGRTPFNSYLIVARPRC